MAGQQALAVISAEGAQALSMRAIAGRLGVVPGALCSGCWRTATMPGSVRGERLPACP